ncbi:MAG: class I SAM-dependent methyltransferase [Alistipes shahii]
MATNKPAGHWNSPSPKPVRTCALPTSVKAARHQTEVLARHLGGTITAVDLLPEMIEGLEVRMRRAGLNDRVTGLVGSMHFDLPFRDGSSDLI